MVYKFVLKLSGIQSNFTPASIYAYVYVSNYQSFYLPIVFTSPSFYLTIYLSIQLSIYLTIDESLDPVIFSSSLKAHQIHATFSAVVSGVKPIPLSIPRYIEIER